MEFQSQEDLQYLIASGALSEGHYFDVKWQLSKNNVGLAKDLASFAIDGGTIVLGIFEHKDEGRFELRPIPTRGVAEAVDQVARQRVHPPLGVSSRTIPAVGAGDGVGYVVVSIPPSVHAPHMVEGSYYARSDVTNMVLSDEQVRRLLATQLEREVEFERMLDAEEVTFPPFGGRVVMRRCRHRDGSTGSPSRWDCCSCSMSGAVAS